MFAARSSASRIIAGWQFALLVFLSDLPSTPAKMVTLRDRYSDRTANGGKSRSGGGSGTLPLCAGIIIKPVVIAFPPYAVYLRIVPIDADGQGVRKGCGGRQRGGL